MAVDVYSSENFIAINSPRFSFSNEHQESKRSNIIKDYPCRLDRNLIDSALDFAFNVDTSTAFQSSTADELFSNGKIRPTRVRNEGITRKVKQDELVVPCLDLQSASATMKLPNKKSLKEFLEDTSSEEEETNEVSTKLFWKFRRSNSLNCDRNRRKKFLGPSSKQLLRSGSTGKVLEKIMEEEPKPNSTNISFFRMFSRSNSISNSVNVNANNNGLASTKGVNQSLQMLRRSHSTSDQHVAQPISESFRRSNSTGSAPDHARNKKGQQSLKHQQNAQNGQVKMNRAHSFGNYYYSNNVKTSPALNLPSPYISRVSVDLFGFGSLFCNGSNKDRKKKKI